MDPDDLQRWTSQLSPEDFALIEEKVSDVTGEGWRTDPATMAEHFGGAPLDSSWRNPPHVRYLSRKFRQLHTGESRRQIWNLPGRYGKSRVAQWGLSWSFDRRPEARSMYICYGDDLADEGADAVRQILRFHAGSLRCQLRRDRQRLDRFVTDEGGGLLARGIDSAITGFGVGGGGGIVLDDPYKNWQEAHSETARKKIYDKFRGTLLNRLDDEDAWILIIHHRMHENDITAQLLADMLTSGEFGDQWDRTSLPAIAVSGDPLGREPGEPLDPERFPKHIVLNRAAGLGSYLACTPAETPILMADWTERPISDVKVGDRVVGFVAEPGHKVRYQPTTVLAVEHRPGLVSDYKMSSGRPLRATRDHRWFVRSGRDYQVAHLGSPLRQVTEVWTSVSERERELWSWLAGMIDGEGHIKRSAINIVQAVPRNAPVADCLRATLIELGIPYNERYEIAKEGDARSDRVCFDLGRAGWVLRMCLEHTPLAKRDQAAVALYQGSGRTDRKKDPVLAIVNDSAEEVYALRTETGNYVAWGYASSNSGLEQQEPTPEEGNDIKRAWFRIEPFDASTVSFDDALCSWDTKMKDKESGDFVVGQVWGRSGTDFWCLAEFRGQWNQATMRAAMALVHVRFPWVWRQVVEYTGYGPEVIEHLTAGSGEEYMLDPEVAGQLGMNDAEKEMVQQLLRNGLPGIIGSTPQGDKRVRARQVTPVIEARNCHLPTNAAFVPGFLDEIAAFPNGTHDDRVDAMSQALSKLWGQEATLVEPELLTETRIPGMPQSRFASG